MCNITKGGRGGQNVRKCEKGEEGLKILKKKRDIIFEQPLMKNTNDPMTRDIAYLKVNPDSSTLTVPSTGTSYFELSAIKDEENLFNMSRDSYHTFIAHHMTSLGTSAVVEALRLYSRVSPTPYYTSPAHFPTKPSSQLCHMIGDVSHVCPIKLLADSFTYVHNSPAYLYVAELYPSHNMELSTTLATTFVGWDMLALFDGFADLQYSAGQGDFNFKNIIREEVLSFAKTGKPDAKRWEALPGNAGIVGRGVTVEKAEDRYFRKCEFWKKHGFFGYTWVDDLSTYQF